MGLCRKMVDNEGVRRKGAEFGARIFNREK